MPRSSYCVLCSGEASRRLVCLGEELCIGTSIDERQGPMICLRRTAAGAGRVLPNDLYLPSYFIIGGRPRNRAWLCGGEARSRC